MKPRAGKDRTRAGSREPLAPTRRFLVFDSKPRVCGESAEAADWLERTRGEAELVEAIRRFQSSGRSTASVALELGEVRLTRMSARRSVRFLVELPLRTRPTAGESLLSKTQIQVARQAAEGATLQEIARRMDRSPDTIRSHLREVYLRLEVSTRIELARALADWKGP